MLIVGHEQIVPAILLMEGDIRMNVKLPSSYRVALYIQEDRHGEERSDSLLSQLQMLKAKVGRWGTISDVYFDICSAKVPYRDRSGLSTLICNNHRRPLHSYGFQTACLMVILVRFCRPLDGYIFGELCNARQSSHVETVCSLIYKGFE